MLTFVTEKWAKDIGIDFLAVIACLLFPRSVLLLVNLSVPYRLQTCLCHTQEQPHGPLSPRHDDAVSCPYAHRGLLLLRLLLCLVDVSDSTLFLNPPNQPSA